MEKKCSFLGWNGHGYVKGKEKKKKNPEPKLPSLDFFQKKALST